MTFNNSKLDLVNMNAYIKLVKICQEVLKILIGNKILTLIKGHDSGTNVRKIKCNNPKVDHVNINAHMKFTKFL